MKNWSKDLSGWSIRTKVVVIFFSTIFFPVIIINLITAHISEKKNQELVTSAMVGSVNQNFMNIGSSLLKYENICNRYSFNNELINVLSLDGTYEDSYSEYQDYQRIENIILNDAMTQDFQIDMKIYYLNNNFPQDLVNFIKVDPKIQNSKFFKEAVKANGKIVWLYDNGKLSLSKVILDYQGALLGVIQIEMPISKITSLINKYKASNMTILIYDSKKEVIYTNNNAMAATKVASFNFFRDTNDHVKQLKVSKPPGDYLVIHNHFNRFEEDLPDWGMITMVPMNEIMVQSMQVKQQAMLIGIVTFLLFCILFFYLLNQINRSIRNIVEKMQEIGEGKFPLIEDKGTNNEIGIIIRTFNRMSTSLKQLFYENVETKLQLKDSIIKKREAELYALQSQIHPHFLFNTLESIRMKLRKQNVDEAISMVLNLSKMLRSSLNMRSEMIDLFEEIELVKSYVAIQKFRFKEKLTYQLDVPEKFLHVKIPKLIIQPIVENAIKHGIEPKWDGGNVSISISQNENLLVIMVKDDGIGMDAKTIETVTSQLNQQDQNGQKIGIKNVHERIVLRYGSQYGLDIQSVMGQCTIVKIRLPISHEYTLSMEEFVC